jgi:hypothetical protein
VTTTDRSDRHYLHRLGYHLQARGLPDEQIDDILAEAQSHAAQSGESLQEAFGSPRDYARRWDVPATRGRWLPVLAIGVAVAVGSAALYAGAIGLAGDDAGFGLTPPWLLVLGTAVLVGTAAVAPLRALRDAISTFPRPSRSAVVLMTLGYCAIMVAAGVVGALL